MHPKTVPSLSLMAADKELSGGSSQSTVDTKPPQAPAAQPESTIKTGLPPTLQKDRDASDQTPDDTQLPQGASESSTADNTQAPAVQNVPPVETLQSATVPDVDHEIEEVETVDRDGRGPRNEAALGSGTTAGAAAAGNGAQDPPERGFYTCCKSIWSCFYTRPYFLIGQTVAALVFAAICAYKARGVSRKDTDYHVELAIIAGVPIVWFIVLAFLFFFKAQLKTSYKNARTRLVSYLCYFKMLRALLVVGLLRVFVFLTDVLGEKKNLDFWAVGFYYVSALHVISAVKLFTIDDILCLSDSLIAVGIFVSSRVEIEGLGNLKKQDREDAIVNKVVLLVCCYASAILIVCFKYATIPYGNLPEDPAAQEREPGTGLGNEAALGAGTDGTGTGGTGVDSLANV